jgi:hypothetical protein
MQNGDRHDCEENKSMGTALENYLYWGGEEWMLSVECDSAIAYDIKYCPFCGTKLEVQL